MSINKGYKRTCVWEFQVGTVTSSQYVATRNANRIIHPPFLLVFINRWRLGFLFHPPRHLLPFHLLRVRLVCVVALMRCSGVSDQSITLDGFGGFESSIDAARNNPSRQPRKIFMSKSRYQPVFFTVHRILHPLHPRSSRLQSTIRILASRDLQRHTPINECL